MTDAPAAPTPRAIADQLEPGEPVLWHARGRPWGALLDAGVDLALRVVVPVILVLIVWSLLRPAEREAALATLQGAGQYGIGGLGTLALVGLVVALMFLLRAVLGVIGALGRLVATVGRASRAHYAVTDRRVLIVDGARATSLKRLPMLRVERRPFGYDLSFDGRGLGFAGIADAEVARRHLVRFLAEPDGGVRASR